MKIDAFAVNEKLKISSRMVGHNPYMESGDMDNWRVTLSGNGRRLTIYYSKGMAYHGEAPTMIEVLRCLADDAALIENSNDFDDFCGETGACVETDADRKQEERSYKQCLKQAEGLKTFLGEKAYKQLLWKVDRE